MPITEVNKSMFDNAQQIFIKNCRNIVNFQAGFKCRFHALAGSEYELHITGATLYSIYLNGSFIFYGPARAPHGYLARGYSKAVSDGGGKHPMCESGRI